MSNNQVVIIGAGIAGLSAGCYARMNGYKTTIFELHDKPGGLCTAWKRKGYTIDGCIHWLIGSKPGALFYQLWEELGAVQGREFFYADQYNQYEAKDGRKFILYADIDRLEQHMLELAFEDKKIIREFCKAVRGFSKLDMPIGKPRELMNILDYLKMTGMLMKYFPLMKWNRQTMFEVMQGVKNPIIREGILSAWPAEFPAGFLLTTLAYLHRKSAGYPIGGSLEFARSIEKRFLNLGGDIQYCARVIKILTENGRAIGVKLSDGNEIRADYIISAADMHSTIFEMLEPQYISEKINSYFKSLSPYTTIVFIGFGVNRKFDDVPPMVASLRIELEKPIKIADRELKSVGFHIFNNDPTLAPPNKTAAVSMMRTSYSWWQNIYHDKNRYNTVKQEIADKIVKQLEHRFPGITGQIEMLDVATPMTFVRYTGNWQGSVQGWSTTPTTWRMQLEKKLPKLGNFWMCGQWTEPLGGLPPSALSGRNVIWNICYQDKKKFASTVAPRIQRLI
jgi:phytoene dehydrogenase-like protein